MCTLWGERLVRHVCQEEKSGCSAYDGWGGKDWRQGDQLGSYFSFPGKQQGPNSVVIETERREQP